VFPHLVDYNVVGYYVHAGEGRQRFDQLDDALAYARSSTEQSALEEAFCGGAVSPQVVFDTRPEGADSYRVVTRAIGMPALGK